MQDARDRLDILDFLTGQLNAGALPFDQAMVAELFELAAATDGERADRAWLALHARAGDRSPPPPARPRVLWYLEAARGAAGAALDRFFDINEPSEGDLDELFEQLRARAAPDFASRLPALVRLRPCAAAALLADRLPDAAADAMLSAPPERALDFGECLRAAGHLRGPAAAAHLRNLCARRPAAVRAFLVEEAGRVRPEDALTIVREAGMRDAEPLCLEAAGDASGALDALLRLGGEAALGEASALCARVAPTVPLAAAADMWSRLLRGLGGGAVPPALLLEALAYLPAEEALQRACASRAAAMAMATCATHRAQLWACCARVTGREAHASLARALAEAGRGVAVRGACACCGRALSARAACRTAHCARALHADCTPERCCGACGRCVPERAVTLPPRVLRADTPPPGFDLVVSAPPRPDLEGVV